MLRVLLRKCFYCSKIHERGVEIRSLCTTAVSKATKKVRAGQIIRVACYNTDTLLRLGHLQNIKACKT